MGIVRDALRGATAGAAGTVALDITTYLDMAIRGRSSSGVPATVAGSLTETAGIDLAPDGNSEAAENRKSGIGALMGYVVGLGVGATYGVIRPRLSGSSVPLAGAVLELAAMAGSDVPATVTGATDPRGWGTSGSLSDVVPHLAYGLVTAMAFESFDGESSSMTSKMRKTKKRARL
jgi:hypothetical protein